MTPPATAAPLEVNTTVGVCIGSSVVNVRVTSWPTFACAVNPGSLSDTRLMVPAVGAVLSNVTLVASSTFGSSAPALPARSLKLILKVIGPAMSLAWATYAAWYAVPMPGTTVTAFVTAVPPEKN